MSICKYIFFFFNDTATTEIYTLSLHDALPIYNLDLYYEDDGAGPPVLFIHGGFGGVQSSLFPQPSVIAGVLQAEAFRTISYDRDRKSTRLNSSHANISYAVFCLKKKKKILKMT